MKLDSTLACALALLFPLTACGDGSKTADVVQAATKGAAEIGQHLAEKAAELANLTPAEAKAKLQGLLDTVATELKALKDSEAAQRLLAEVELVFDRLVELAQKLGEKLDLADLRDSLVDLAERFKNDPRVENALANLKEKLDGLTH